MEANGEETFTFYRLPAERHKHLKSTNMSERINEEIKRRTLVVGIFPNRASCLRLLLTGGVSWTLFELWGAIGGGLEGLSN